MQHDDRTNGAPAAELTSAELSQIQGGAFSLPPGYYNDMHIRLPYPPVKLPVHVDPEPPIHLPLPIFARDSR